jgi:hypothetical protein
MNSRVVLEDLDMGTGLNSVAISKEIKSDV